MSFERSEPATLVQEDPKPFVYRSVNSTNGNGVPRRGAASTAYINKTSASEPAPNLQEVERQAFDRGVQEGRTQVAREFEEGLVRERQALGVAIESFSDERDSYFRDVETEVVRLALAICNRILHREAQTDPFALSGLVRVALQKVADGTIATLRVHPSRLSAWQAYFARQLDFPTIPELLADPALEQDSLVLETVLGTTELSLDGQLKEVEQGFFDLLDRRPRIAK